MKAKVRLRRCPQDTLRKLDFLQQAVRIQGKVHSGTAQVKSELNCTRVTVTVTRSKSACGRT